MSRQFKVYANGSSFNGGKSQINMPFVHNSGDFAFLNLVKAAQSWTYNDNSAFPSPDELDTNGYPLAGSSIFTTHGGVYTVFQAPSQTQRPGNYVVTWGGISTISLNMVNTVLPTATFTGSVTNSVLTAGAPSGGTIQKGMPISTIGGIIGDQISGTAGAAGTYNVIGLASASSQTMTITGGSKTGTSNNNRYVFSTTSTTFDVRFSAATETPSNLRVFHVDDEADLNAGKILGKKFREQWAYMNAGAVRFLDWQAGNNSNVTTWATRKPINYVFYSGSEYRASLWAGTTTNVGDAYTTTLTPSSWSGVVDKATIIVRFNATASGDSPTLTAAGITKPIKNEYGDAINSGSRPSANQYATLVFDATLDCWLKFPGQGINNGVPPEVMLAVARELRAHPWYVTPFLAADPLTDYMPSLAAYHRDYAPSWMIPRFEGSNETWNFAFGFFATRYAWNKGLAYWGVSFDENNWYGRAVSLLGQAVSTVYSNNRSRYQVVAGVKTVSACNNSSCSVSGTSGSDPRLTSTRFVSSGPAQSGYTQSAAYNWVTHVAMANYLSPTAYGSLQELRDAYSYAVTNAGNPSAQAALAGAYADTLGGAAAIYNLAYVKNAAQFWYAWAQGNWGGSINLGLTAYEGGWSPDYAGDWSSAVTGATQANPCVLTLATTSNNRGTISGNPAVVGMQVTLSGVGGMTQLNGNTYTVSAVAGNSVTINVDASGFSAFTSGGTALYVNSGTYTTALRGGARFTTNLQTQMTQHYADMASVPMTFPSHYYFSAAGSVWGLYDPTVYSTPYSTEVEVIRSFNISL